MASGSFHEIVAHLGGEAQLTALGCRAYDSDNGHTCLKLLHGNPRGVNTVTIVERGDGRYAMDCFGRMTPQSFSAPLLGRADDILAENLATVLGQLTGMEELHHRHY